MKELSWRKPPKLSVEQLVLYNNTWTEHSWSWHAFLPVFYCFLVINVFDLNFSWSPRNEGDAWAPFTIYTLRYSLNPCCSCSATHLEGWGNIRVLQLRARGEFPWMVPEAVRESWGPRWPLWHARCWVLPCPVDTLPKYIFQNYIFIVSFLCRTLKVAGKEKRGVKTNFPLQ